MLTAAIGPSETSAQRWAMSGVGGQPEAPLRRTKSPLLTQKVILDGSVARAICTQASNRWARSALV